MERQGFTPVQVKEDRFPNFSSKAGTLSRLKGDRPMNKWSPIHHPGMKAHQQDVQRCLYNIDYRRTVFVESIKPVYIYKYIQILQSSSVQVQGHASIGTNWIRFYSFGIHWINEKGVKIDFLWTEPIGFWVCKRIRIVRMHRDFRNKK